MALTELAGIWIFAITLSLQSVAVLGESAFTSDTDKSAELRATDKRMDNFRVPVETPYDPNFWPARGRRSRHPEKGGEGDMCDAPFTSVRCADGPEEQPGKRKWPPSDPEDEPYDRSDGNCEENGMGATSRGRLGKKPRDFGDGEGNLGPKRPDKARYKKQRLFRLPQLILYGNNGFWESGNPYAEKKKKEDVFWVARGKKNFLYRK